MKIPRLKNYFVAVPPDLYPEFESTRVLPVTPMTVDIVSGTVRGRPHWYLAAQPDLADNIVREQYRYGGVVYILRVPADCVDRNQLRALEGSDQVWQYNHAITIPHCAVYTYESSK
jgi:hypothetical protein